MKKKPQSVIGAAMLPGMRDYEMERTRADEILYKRISEQWSRTDLSTEAIWTSKLLICCGLPLRETESSRITRLARLVDGNYVRVTFVRTSDVVPLPFGADRTMAFFLTHKAVTEKSPYLKWDHVNEYMTLFNLRQGGKDYLTVQERFIRVAYMDILVEHLDQRQQVVEHFKTPIIDSARISVRIDGEGNWQPAETTTDMLAADQKVTFGLRFYNDLRESSNPIPFPILEMTAGKYRLMDHVIFLWWRAYVGQAETLIPWNFLQGQFDHTDSNKWRWASHFKEAITCLKSMPGDFSQFHAEVRSNGLWIKPYPVGVDFFKGQPKLGYRKPKQLKD